MLLELTIGRDATTGQLRMSNGKQAQSAGAKDSVPKSVSREHVRLSVTEKGELILKNLHVENDTFVNGRAVEQKLVQRGDKIELGNERWELSWEKVLDPVIPKFCDIRPLEQVWKDYRESQIENQIRERRFNALRSATGLLTMGAVALSGVFGRDNSLYLALYGSAGLISAVFFVLSYRWASKIPIENAKLQEEAEKKYACPQCGKLFPLQKYDQLKQQGCCIHCKGVFIS